MAGRLASLLVAVIATVAAWSWHEPPMSVIVITLDTTRADRLSVYGFNNAPMPGLERLAREGVVFDRATAVAPLTLPAHCSVFTGLFPPAHGVRDNADGALSQQQTTLAEILKARGFQTAAFVGSTVLDSDRGLAQGFDYYSTVPRAGSSAHSFGAAQRPADAVMNDALQWIEAHDEKSFFAWVHLYDAHRPYEAPEPFRSRFLDPYVAEIAFADAQIARLLTALNDRHVLERTIVVVVGDHGESLGEHGERDHGIFVYEASMQVPLIVRAPGLTARRVDAVVSQVDVLPTLLDLLRIPAPPGIDGVTLVPASRGSMMVERELYAESMYPSRFGWSPLRMVRDARLKYIDAPRPELYDLDADPFERHDLASQRPNVVAGMRARLAGFAAEKPAGLPGNQPSEEAVRALASLGYSSGHAAVPSSSALDPKDFIRAFSLRQPADTGR